MPTVIESPFLAPGEYYPTIPDARTDEVLRSATRLDEREQGSRLIPVTFGVVERPIGAGLMQQSLPNAVELLSGVDPGFISIDCISTASIVDSNRTVTTAKEVAPSANIVPVVEWFGHDSEYSIKHTLTKHVEAGAQEILVKPSNGELSGRHEPENGRKPLDVISIAREMALFQKIGVVIRPEKALGAKTAHGNNNRVASDLEAADYGITQFLMSSKPWTNIVRAMRGRNIKTPIIPGILVYTGAWHLSDLARRQGITVPNDDVTERIKTESIKDPFERERRKLFSAQSHALVLGLTLVRKGAPGIHIYTDNNAVLAAQVAESVRNTK